MKKTVCVWVIAMGLAGAILPASAATKVFLLAGQSNMDGVGRGAELVGPLAKYSGQQPGVKIWDHASRKWVTLSSSMNGNIGFGPEVSFGYKMHAAFPHDSIYLYKYALASTNLYFEWNPNGAGTSFPCYDTFKSGGLAAVQALKDAKRSPIIAGMLWMQGEGDASNPYWAAAYQKNLIDFIAHVRRDFNTPDMPFVIARIIKSYGTPENNALVRAAEVTVPTLVPHTTWVNTDDLQLSQAVPLHYGTQGQIDLGNRFAIKILK